MARTTLRSLWDNSSDSDTETEKIKKATTVNLSTNEDEDDVEEEVEAKPTRRGKPLTRIRDQSKRIMHRLETEYRYDLGLHLYSLHLLHQVQPEFPGPNWVAWPLPVRFAPVPRYISSEKYVDEPEYMVIGDVKKEEEMKLNIMKFKNYRKKMKLVKEKRKENEADVVEVQGSAIRNREEETIIPNDHQQQESANERAGQSNGDVIRKENFSSDDESDYSLVLRQSLRSVNGSPLKKRPLFGDDSDTDESEDEFSKRAKRSVMVRGPESQPVAEPETTNAQPVPEPETTNTQQPPTITNSNGEEESQNQEKPRQRDLLSAKEDSGIPAFYKELLTAPVFNYDGTPPNHREVFRQQIDAMFKRKIAARFQTTKDQYPDAQPSTEIRTPEELYERIQKRFDDIFRPWAPNTKRIGKGARTWRDILARYYATCDDKESCLTLRGKFDKFFKDIPRKTLRGYLRKLREMEAEEDSEDEDDESEEDETVNDEEDPEEEELEEFIDDDDDDDSDDDVESERTAKEASLLQKYANYKKLRSEITDMLNEEFDSTDPASHGDRDMLLALSEFE